MKKSLLFLLLIGSLTVSAQTISPQVRLLASQITSGITKDSLKVRAIYTWLADNIAYDVDQFNQRTNRTMDEYAESQKPERVIVTRKAVCMGYSMLFQDLCLSLNIKAQHIAGYCKSLDPQTRTLTFSNQLHSWNAVKINGRWYLCDPSWSAGAVNMATGRFQKKLNEEYYLTDSQTFIQRHLPFDPLWQLRYEPVSLQQFRSSEIIPKVGKRITLNYTDSLKVFETQDFDTQKLNAYFRSFKFDQSNDEAKAGIGYYYAQQAQKDSKAWHELLMTFMNKNTADSYRRAMAEKNRVYQLLESVERGMNQARYYYSLIPSHSLQSRVAINNVRNADHFLTVVEQNRANMAKYYDTLKKAKY